MALNRVPVKGMKDILPDEMAIREYVLSIIKETYKNFGFTQIETPAMEDINNLTGSHGGENEKLIYKVLKRGEKLNLEAANTPDDLVDAGLRYDLTVPLVRYFSNNQEKLTKPFKALQIGSVWRADRPQRGRFRQFTQCDIDILGDGTNLAEIELITATSTVLSKLGFSDFTVKINHRVLLKLMALACNVSEDMYESLFIALDKLDKIGLEGVMKELSQLGLSEDSVNAFGKYFGSSDVMTIEALSEKLKQDLPDNTTIDKTIDDLKEIIDAVNAVKPSGLTLTFDPTLVRGMGYYTGPIFEISIPEFSSSCGGGGRYDEMISKFTSQSIPACGFSIGFERIITLLMESGFKVPESNKKVAYLAEKGLCGKDLIDMLTKARGLRNQGIAVLIQTRSKNARHQIDELNAKGYEEVISFYKTREE